jgi:hypothetical protein
MARSARASSTTRSSETLSAVEGDVVVAAEDAVSGSGPVVTDEAAVMVVVEPDIVEGTPDPAPHAAHNNPSMPIATILGVVGVTTRSRI